jgi:hypothetical protein
MGVKNTPGKQNSGRVNEANIEQGVADFAEG